MPHAVPTCRAISHGHVHIVVVDTWTFIWTVGLGGKRAAALVMAHVLRRTVFKRHADAATSSRAACLR